MEERLQFLGHWKEDEQRRLQLALDTMAPHMRAGYRQRLRGPWVGVASRQSGGMRYYVLHRVGLGKAITGASLGELIDGLISSGVYEPPFSAGAEGTSI